MRFIRLTHKTCIDPRIEAEYVFRSLFEELYTLPHTHDFFEFFLVTDGQLINVVNNVEMLLKKGTLVFIRSHDRHYFKKSGTQNCHTINLAFPKKTMNALLDYIADGFDAKSLLQMPTPPIAILSDFEIENIKNKLEWLNSLPYSQKNLIKTHLRIILAEIFVRYFAPVQTYKSAMPDWLEELCEEMQKPENFTAGFETLINLACKSKEHVCRSFKMHLNKTPTEFINELRLNYAANQLIRTNKKIVDIVFDVGFENLSHFYHLFKNSYFQSPLKFRKNNRKNYPVQI